MPRRLRTSDLLSDFETYRLWQGLSKKGPTKSPVPSRWKGMLLERRVFHQLSELGFRTLAGRVKELRGLSGIVYENDVLVFKPGVVNSLLIVECKFRREGSLTEKNHVLLFYQRMQDILMYYAAIGYPKILLPVFVSSVPLDRNAFRFCLTYGILSLHPCYESSSIYSSMVACRPPLAALRYLLSTLHEEKPESSGVIKGLIRSITRLHRYTIRYISPFYCFRGALDGNKLEKAYFDILYRCKSVLETW